MLTRWAGFSVLLFSEPIRNEPAGISTTSISIAWETNLDWGLEIIVKINNSKSGNVDFLIANVLIYDIQFILKNLTQTAPVIQFFFTPLSVIQKFELLQV